jgi:hypothetical protein
MTSDRLYRRAIGIDAALEELKRRAGTQFDATIVAAFCNNITTRHNSSAEVSTHVSPINDERQLAGRSDRASALGRMREGSAAQGSPRACQRPQAGSPAAGPAR